MLLADQHNALLIDLQPTELSVASFGDDGTATVVGDFDGIDGDVEIRLTETPKERWRVHQVLVPGGDEESIPWGVVH
jgi:hypothetical protein